MNFADDIQQQQKLTTRGKNWTQNEDIKFIIFIFAHREVFFNTKITDQSIFQEMAEYIGGKTSKQCNTHYKNIKRKFKSQQNNTNQKIVEKFIENLQLKYEYLNTEAQKIRTHRIQAFNFIQLILRKVQSQMNLIKYYSCYRKVSEYDHQFVKRVSLLGNIAVVDEQSINEQITQKNRNHDKICKRKCNDNFEEQILTPDIKSVVQLSQNQKSADLIQKVKKPKDKRWQNLGRFRYLLFLLYYKRQLQGPKIEKKKKWYSLMSKVIGNSVVDSCRIIHTNNLVEFKNIDGIINHFKMRILYEKINREEQIKRFLDIIEVEERTKQQFYKNFFENEFTEESVRILKFHSIVLPSVQSSLEVPDEIYTQEDKIIEEKRQPIRLPIEILLIIKRKTVLNDGNQELETNRINQIIKKFQKGHKMTKRARNLCIRNKTKNQHIANQSVTEKKDQQEQKVKNLKRLKPQSFEQVQGSCQKKESKWKKPQLVKFIIFLQIMKEKREKQNLNTIENINLKCSEYINTNKTSTDCKHMMYFYRKMYKQKFWNLIENQVQKHLIPEQLIEMEKQRYFFLENNPPHCCIKLQIEKNQQISQTMLKYERKIVEESSKQKQNLLVKFKINSQVKQSEQKAKRKASELNNQDWQNKEKLRYVLQVQLSNEMFLRFKRSLRKQDHIYKTINKIVKVQNIFFNE